jgi:isochorismate synthase
LKDLHPTPAVCGVPKSEALNFIIANENYTRTYYTGYFGELNIQNASELFVNLRCMQFIKNKSQLEIYVGGGITAQSNSEKEYEETVSKAQIMKRIL